MPAELHNLEFVEAFARNVNEVDRSSDRIAERFGEALRDIIVARVDRGEYLGGSWQTKSYSTAPIKAFKLGNPVITGEGMGKELSIDGIPIDNEDWYWGSEDKKRKGVPDSPWGSGVPFGDSFSGKPAPVFIPGYRGWKVFYNQLTDVVDLRFSGTMLDNFSVEIKRTRGSNQFGGRYNYEFIVEGQERDTGNITDYYRKWKAITQEELDEAVNEIGEEIISILFGN